MVTEIFCVRVNVSVATESGAQQLATEIKYKTCLMFAFKFSDVNSFEIHSTLFFKESHAIKRNQIFKTVTVTLLNT